MEALLMDCEDSERVVGGCSETDSLLSRGRAAPARSQEEEQEAWPTRPTALLPSAASTVRVLWTGGLLAAGVAGLLGLALLAPGGSRATADLAAKLGLLSSAELAANPLFPNETRGDGNHCADDEEELAGLCYAKCNSLTNGKYPFRQSAWHCCVRPNCLGFFLGLCDCQHEIGLCSGFDIAGMQEGKAICPHKPGVCLVNEELFLGVCYMKCSLLTGGQYPFRVAAATCCKRTDASCLIEDNLADSINGQSLTNASYNVGGGCQDASPLTHCKPSLPNEALTR